MLARSGTHAVARTHATAYYYIDRQSHACVPLRASIETVACVRATACEHSWATYELSMFSKSIRSVKNPRNSLNSDLQHAKEIYIDDYFAENFIHFGDAYASQRPLFTSVSDFKLQFNWKTIPSFRTSVAK